MRLFKLLLGVIFVSIILGTTGCGGGGNNANSFQGNWSGTQRFFDFFGAAQDQGFLTITIDEAGFLIGTITKTSNGETQNVQGSVQPGGSMVIQWQFNGELRRTAQGDVEVSGGQLSPTSSENTLPVSNSNGPVGRLEFFLNRA